MDSPERSNVKAPKGVNILLGPFSSTFQELPFLDENLLNLQDEKGGYNYDYKNDKEE